jgi:methionyl-tRNA synthetase
MAALLDQLGVPADRRQLADIDPAHRLAAGDPLPAPQPIFPRYIEPEADASGAAR